MILLSVKQPYPYCFWTVYLHEKLISLYENELVFSLFGFSFYKHSRITGQQQKRGGISLTPLYHFHLLHRLLDISLVIIADKSSLHIASVLLTGFEPATVGFRAQFANHLQYAISYAPWEFVLFISYIFLLPLPWNPDYGAC